MKAQVKIIKTSNIWKHLQCFNNKKKAVQIVNVKAGIKQFSAMWIEFLMFTCSCVFFYKHAYTTILIVIQTNDSVKVLQYL